MTSTAALTVRDPWSVVPSLGNLDAYVRAVQDIPMLEADEEQALARRLREQQDLQAAGKLVLSHLRLVVSISRQYVGYGLPQGDLIQEGNVGLMKAVKRFDPDQGVRLVSYAMHWIKAEIHEYILKNWRMVKVATTKAQRKLFFNLRSLKHQYKGDADDSHVGRSGFSESEIHRVAQELDVRPEDVIEMETRMAGGDVAMESTLDDDHEGAMAPVAYLADDRHEPTRVIEGWRVTSTGQRTPLTSLSWNEYHRLGNLTTPGYTNSYFVDKQAANLMVRFWPVPDTAVATGTLELLLQTQATAPTELDETISFPVEWYLALRWALADELSSGQPAIIMERCAGKAASYRQALEDWDVEDTPTRFQPDSLASGLQPSRFR